MTGRRKTATELPVLFNRLGEGQQVENGAAPRQFLSLNLGSDYLIASDNAIPMRVEGIRELNDNAIRVLNYIMGLACNGRRRYSTNDDTKRYLSPVETESGAIVSYSLGGVTAAILSATEEEREGMPDDLLCTETHPQGMIAPARIVERDGRMISYAGAAVLITKSELAEGIYGSRTKDRTDLVEKAVRSLQSVALKLIATKEDVQRNRQQGIILPGHCPVVDNRNFLFETGKRGREALDTQYIFYVSPLLGLRIEESYVSGYPFKQLNDVSGKTGLHFRLVAYIYKRSPVKLEYSGDIWELLSGCGYKSKSNYAKSARQLLETCKNLQSEGVIDHWRVTDKRKSGVPDSIHIALGQGKE